MTASSCAAAPGPRARALVRAIGFFTKVGGDAAMMPLLVELDPTDKPQILGAEVWRIEPDAS